MGVPKEIPDFGDSDQTLRPNPEFDPIQRGITSEEYYVLSRVDGAATLRDLILMVGFPTEKTITILRSLRKNGGVLLPDETPEMVAKLVEAGDQLERQKADAEQAASVDGDLTAEEEAAMAEDVDLSHEQKRRVIAARRTLASGNYFEILRVPPTANKREVKRAYFRLSKDFHPDRYYNKNTASFGPWLDDIFEAATTAYDVLSDPTRRDKYERQLRGEPASEAKPRTQTKKEHAAQLYERACGLEVRGEVDEALTIFSAVVRVYPTARYYRRASACAITAQNLEIASDFAQKAVEIAPKDPSYARALADVFYASGMLERAQETLEHALTLKTENDVLAGELQADLERVRRSMSSG